MRAVRDIAELTVMAEAGSELAGADLLGDGGVGFEIPGLIEERIGRVAKGLTVAQVILQDHVEIRCR